MEHFEEFEKYEYGTVTELVTAGVLYDLVKQDIKEDLILFIEQTRRRGDFYIPTDLKINNDLELAIPLTLRSLKGYFFQWEKEKERAEKYKFSKDGNLKAKQIKTSLTDIQIGKLYDLLTEGEVIKEADKMGFIWAFGGNVQGFAEFSIKWDRTKSLLAYFVDVMNFKTMGNDGENRRTQWKPFELIFGKDGLRGAKNDYQKTGTLPEGSEQIDKIIDDVLKFK